MMKKRTKKRDELRKAEVARKEPGRVGLCGAEGPSDQS